MIPRQTVKSRREIGGLTKYSSAGARVSKYVDKELARRFQRYSHCALKDILSLRVSFRRRFEWLEVDSIDFVAQVQQIPSDAQQ